MNRVTAAIARMEQQIADRIATGKTTQKKVDQLAKTLDMDVMEHAMFQERKSLAFAMQKLNADEAQSLYVMLGNTPSVFNRQPIAVKSVLTKLFAELMQS
jgi:hypothetical protein